VDWACVEEWRGKMNGSLDKIEQIWLDGGKRKYITGLDKISVADIFALVELDQPNITGYEFNYCLRVSFVTQLILKLCLVPISVLTFSPTAPSCLPT
jgi:hypothetical protein